MVSIDHMWCGWNYFIECNGIEIVRKTITGLFKGSVLCLPISTGVPSVTLYHSIFMSHKIHRSHSPI